MLAQLDTDLLQHTPHNTTRLSSRILKLSRSSGMLILTRRVNEALMVGDDVTVTVLGISGNQVRIGVQAPRHVSVHREEIYEKIKQEKLAAPGSS